jgi:NaMN:DMB phosphoribosyltransferase
MMRPLALAAVLVFATAACVPTQPVAPMPEPVASIDDRDPCFAKALADLIGKPLTNSSVPPASPRVRHIRPGDAVTEDLREERLNIYVTSTDMIEKINCG